jgi:RNA recognition motif-containing protein
MTFYVSNLSPKTTQEELRKAFGTHGTIELISLPTDRMAAGAAGTSRGYAFVTMKNNDEARAAKAALEGKAIQGLPLSISVARPRAEALRR